MPCLNGGACFRNPWAQRRCMYPGTEGRTVMVGSRESGLASEQLWQRAWVGPVVLVSGLTCLPCLSTSSLSGSHAESWSPSNQLYSACLPRMLWKPLSAHLCTESEESCIWSSVTENVSTNTIYIHNFSQLPSGCNAISGCFHLTYMVSSQKMAFISILRCSKYSPAY